MRKLILLCFTLIISWLNLVAHQEGFLENTLVGTPTGYQKIQDLHVGDTIYNTQFEEKKITNTFQYLADQYLQLTIDDQIINCAPEQQLYLPLYQSWMQACHLTEKECNAIKIIQKPVLIYCITVQDHTFQISHHNIIAHNSAATILAPSLIFSFIKLMQPVLTLLGATISLYYFSSYNPAITQGDTIIYQPSPEKNYFDTRYQQLTKLKQEFLSVHATVKIIKCQFQDQYALLSYQQIFNPTLMHTCTMTAEYEAQLDFEQRLQLTNIRQKILHDIEDEICNIQIAIGLFTNEIIHKQNVTTEYYNAFIDNNQDPLHTCLKLPTNISYQTIVNYYIFTATCNMLLEEMQNRNQECLVLNQFLYCTSEFFFRTTNILDVLEQKKQDIAASQPVIEKTKLGNQVKLQNIVIYFNRTNKYTFPNICQPINNIQKDLYQKFNNNSQQKSKKQTYPPIKPPQKPEQDDDEQEIPRIYIDAKYHGKNATAIKSAAPKNGQAALDRSFAVTKKIRVGVSENQIVILARTLMKPQGGSEWHGYATTWDDLNNEQKDATKNILIKNKLVNSHGKIL